MKYLVTNLINNNYYNYNYTCFNILNKHININSINNTLNNCNIKLLNNLLKYINIQWTNIIRKLSDKYFDNKYKNLKIITKCNDYNEFNQIIYNFIDKNIIIALVLTNIINNYLSI